MERKIILSCCSTVDLPYSYMEQRDIPVLFYTYVVDGQEYVDDMGRDRRSTSRRTSTSLNSSCSTAICCT